LTLGTSGWRSVCRFAGLFSIVLLIIGISAGVAGFVTVYWTNHDHPVERYNDVVVGMITWLDATKSSDFKYLYILYILLRRDIFIALFVFVGFGMAEAARHAAKFLPELRQRLLRLIGKCLARVLRYSEYLSSQVWPEWR
jgi:hypothetical protein